MPLFIDCSAQRSRTVELMRLVWLGNEQIWLDDIKKVAPNIRKAFDGLRSRYGKKAETGGSQFKRPPPELTRLVCIPSAL